MCAQCSAVQGTFKRPIEMEDKMSASSCRISCVFGLLMATGWFAAGCSSSKKVDVGTDCLLNSDCNSPLSCSFGKCHDACKDTRDCPLGASCVKLSTGSVCQLPADAFCTGLCSENLVCAADQRCRVGCQSAADCLTGQSCVASGTSATSVCADSTDVDVTGQLQQKGVVGAACVLDTDCNSLLSCVMNECHYLCQNTSVCPTGQSCVKTATSAVCQFPAEVDCDSTTLCSGGLVCAVDFRCRASCKSASDCTTGQSCAGGVCADKSDLDPSGQLTPRSPPTKPDSGTNAQTIDSAGKDTNLGAGGAVEVGGSSSSGGASGTFDSGQPDLAGTGGVISSGGSSGIHDSGTPDAAVDQLVDTWIAADAPVLANLDGGGSTVLTGCGKVTTKRYFCDDFESGLSQWLVGADGWNTIDTTFESAIHSVTDSPSGNYPQGANTVMAMATSVDLTGADSPVLIFWHKLFLACDCIVYNPGSGKSTGCLVGTTVGPCDASGSDHAYIEISTDGGTTWSQVLDMFDTSNTSTWLPQQLSLSAYVGKKIKLRFRLFAQLSAAMNCTGDGWYLDDIVIQEPT